ncbi:MAG: type II toxin-antitoxin system VapB family antitoxin [Deltaproteobacteria bacterium]|nr:type II toxin-antitoxin system VapB family antitoxin [Deltaproteobacteria bacterium]
MAQANYDLPEEKLTKVKKLAQVPTKKQAIIVALDEYIRRKKIERLISLRGKIRLKWTQSSLKKYRG